jgi:hypothetical protein
MVMSEHADASAIQWKRVAHRAAYHEQIVPLYRGNPWIEALPPMISRTEAERRMARNVPYEPAHSQVDAHVRLHMVGQLQHWLQPLAVNVDLHQRIDVMLRSSYVNRNPVDPSYFVRVADLRCDSWTNESALPIFGMSAPMLAVIGASGVGKTKGVLRALNIYPQVIEHAQYRGEPFISRQLIHLRLECPHDGSVKGLCYQFFQKVDSILGTNYVSIYAKERESTERMITSMAKVAAVHGLGMLVIDEIQYLLDAAKGGEGRMINFLVSLCNALGIPIVLVGTFAAQHVLLKRFRQARRSCGLGDLIWDRMPFGDEFTFFVEQLFGYQYLRRQVPATGEEFKKIAAALYHETQGISALIVLLYMLTQMRGISVGELSEAAAEDDAGRLRAIESERLTPELVHMTALDCFRLVRPLIESLREGVDVEFLTKYDDLISKMSLEELAKTATAFSWDEGAVEDANSHRNRPSVESDDAPVQPKTGRNNGGKGTRPKRRTRSTSEASVPADARLILTARAALEDGELVHAALLRAGLIRDLGKDLLREGQRAGILSDVRTRGDLL